MVSYLMGIICIPYVIGVLILVVVDDGLVLTLRQVSMGAAASLNPCCSGRWSRTYQQQE